MKPRVYRRAGFGWVCEMSSIDGRLMCICGSWARAIEHALAWWKERP